MENPKDQCISNFLKERNFHPIDIGTTPSEEIYNLFAFLDTSLKKLLYQRLGLEKMPDICVFSQAKPYKFHDEMIYSCPPHANYKLYTFENNKLRILKHCLKEEDGSLGDRKGIKKTTRQRNFITKIVKEGWNSFNPMSKSSSKRNNNGKTGERVSDKQAPVQDQNQEIVQTTY